MNSITNNNDTYIRPNITYTDTLTKDEIIDLLTDFEKVNNINNVKLGTYISYIDTKNNNYMYRFGGVMILNKEEYIVLSGGKTNFSVQKQDKIFFKRLNYRELKNEMIRKDNEYKKIIEKKDQQIKELIIYIKKLKKITT